jgi:hypothetical protein
MAGCNILFVPPEDISLLIETYVLNNIFHFCSDGLNYAIIDALACSARKLTSQARHGVVHLCSSIGNSASNGYNKRYVVIPLYFRIALILDHI